MSFSRKISGRYEGAFVATEESLLAAYQILRFAHTAPAVRCRGDDIFESSSSGSNKKLDFRAASPIGRGPRGSRVEIQRWNWGDHDRLFRRDL